MAYTTGTASGYLALVTAISTFVQSTLGWAVMRTDSSLEYERIWKAPGIAGDKEIFMGLKTYSDAALDYYNLKVNGFTGYVSSNTFESQPGRLTNDLGVCLFNQPLPYILVGSGNHLVVAVNVENQWNSFFMGFGNMYCTPSQYPYPLLIGGMLTTASTTRFSDTAYTSWWKGSRENMRMRMPDGNWRQPQVLPYNSGNIIRNTGTDSSGNSGYFQPTPLILSENTTGYVNVYGEIPSMFFISGFQNAVENTITIGGITYLVLRDVGRTGLKDFCCLKLA